MANVLSFDKQVAIVSALAEGSGIRQMADTKIVPSFIALSYFVEVFDLKNHPKANRVYAWAYETDNPKKPKHVTVLHVGPADSPLKAVRAAIIGEFRNRERQPES